MARSQISVRETVSFDHKRIGDIKHEVLEFFAILTSTPDLLLAFNALRFSCLIVRGGG